MSVPLTVKYDSSHELVPELVFPPGPGLCECQKSKVDYLWPIRWQSRLLTLDVSFVLSPGHKCSWSESCDNPANAYKASQGMPITAIWHIQYAAALQLSTETCRDDSHSFSHSSLPRRRPVDHHPASSWRLAEAGKTWQRLSHQGDTRYQADKPGMAWG